MLERPLTLRSLARQSDNQEVVQSWAIYESGEWPLARSAQYVFDFVQQVAGFDVKMEDWREAAQAASTSATSGPSTAAAASSSTDASTAPASAE